MFESIFILYKDEKFEKIRYYLKERGFITLDNLVLFDFDELLFVPGVSEVLISEAKQLFSLADSLSLITRKASSVVKPVCEGNLTSFENVDIDEAKGQNDECEILSKQTVKIKDALITDVYSNAPRSAPFIIYCTNHGKLYMSELSDIDFDQAANLKGLGIASAENLRKVYIEFINSPSLSEDYSVNESLDSLNSIDYLPLSVRAKNCMKQAGISSLEGLLSLAAKDLMSIKNMGTKTCQEILTFCENASFSETEPSEFYYLEDVVSENKSIPITLLRNIGVSEKGIELFLTNNCVTVGDLCARGLTLREYSFARIVNDYMSIPVTERFIYAIDALKDSAKVSMLRRCNGATLEEIGKELQVTRERVRQILAKTCRQLAGTAELVAGILLSSDKAVFTFSNLMKLFPTEESAMYCKLVLQESDYIQYLKFSDSFINIAVCGSDIEDKLKEFTEEIIGEGINFFDNLELIESELKKYTLDYFDAMDIMNFLIHNRCRFYGDYVVKGRQPYAIICHDAVRKFFRFDIKLDSDEDNEDMRTLRGIISKRYQG